MRRRVVGTSGGPGLVLLGQATDGGQALLEFPGVDTEGAAMLLVCKGPGVLGSLHYLLQLSKREVKLVSYDPVVVGKLEVAENVYILHFPEITLCRDKKTPGTMGANKPIHRRGKG